MTATAEAPASWFQPAGPVQVGRLPCGFCSTRDCHLCPETITGATGQKGVAWQCPCDAAGHPGKSLRKPLAQVAVPE